MSEWWTYSLTSFLLFSPRTYYRLFELTNAEVWPAQIATLAGGVAILGLILRPLRWAGRAVATLLVATWLFVAWAYLLQRYDPINWAARYFAMGFVLQAALLAWSILRDRLRFDLDGPPAKAGVAMVVYALALNPLVAPLTGRPWTQTELFGVAPDPTIVATLGVLLAASRPPTFLLVIPLLWCLISGLTLWTMESAEAPLLPSLAFIAVALWSWKALVHRGKTQ
jgi:Family of unknown function (DUF6064)